MNLIAQLEVEPKYYDVLVHHISPYATETPNQNDRSCKISYTSSYSNVDGPGNCSRKVGIPSH